MTTAFERSEVRGVLRLDANAWKQIGERIFHGCHLRDLKPWLHGSAYSPSEWSWKIDDQVGHGEGTWLNFGYSRNHFGPFELSWGAEELAERSFVVMLRGAEWTLVESSGEHTQRLSKGAPSMTGAEIFDMGSDGLRRRVGVSYRILRTTAMDTTIAELGPAHHPECVLKKCAGMDIATAHEVLLKFRERLLSSKHSKKHDVLAARVAAWRLADSDADVAALLRSLDDTASETGRAKLLS